MGDAMVVQVKPDDGVEQSDLRQLLKDGAHRERELVPPMYTEAVPTCPEVVEWVRELVAGAIAGMRFGWPLIKTGRSLVLAGLTGRGKTHQAWGACRALSVAGVSCPWVFVSAADLFAALRPRHGVDSEEVFEGYARASVLVVDDLGATKDSTWTGEVLDRLINTRYSWKAPMLITTNAMPKDFGAMFGDRVTSRLVEMATVVPFTGPDRRRSGGVR